MPGRAFECPDWYGGCGAVWTTSSAVRRAPRYPEVRVCPDCERSADD